jgi:hypothetical protein
MKKDTNMYFTQQWARNVGTGKTHFIYEKQLVLTNRPYLDIACQQITQDRTNHSRLCCNNKIYGYSLNFLTIG